MSATTAAPRVSLREALELLLDHVRGRPGAVALTLSHVAELLMRIDLERPAT